VALTLSHLAMHVLGKQAPDLSDAERDTLGDLLEWANAEIYAYTGTDSMIPEAIRDAAIRRVAYYDYHVRLARRPADGGMLDARFRRDAPLNPLRASGAMALLSPYKRRHVGAAR